MRVGEKGEENPRGEEGLSTVSSCWWRVRMSWINLETEAHTCPQAQGRGAGAPVGTGSSPRLRMRTSPRLRTRHHQ